jgi:hypothetical protein
MNSRPVGDRGSETLFHPIVMINQSINYGNSWYRIFFELIIETQKFITESLKHVILVLICS